MLKLFFVSNNQYKIKEAMEIIDSRIIELKPLALKIEEIQSDDAMKIVNDKVIKAFSKVKRPLFVEHTGLYIHDFGNLPGGLTQIIWDSLKADKFCEFFGNRKNTKAIAKTIIGYCDGKSIYTFEGSIEGNIAKTPKGNKNFQWDCVFIPKGYNQTFAELGDEKNKISMRRQAIQSLSDYIRGLYI